MSMKKDDDGTTEAQRANMRAIYEDPAAYAEWRIRMKLDKGPEVKPSAVMRQRVTALFADLIRELEQRRTMRAPDPWERPAARKLTPEELRELYGKSPPAVSEALQRSNRKHFPEAAE